MSNLTVVNPNEFGIEETQAKGLMGNLPQIKEERSVLESQYNEVIKLDIEDPLTTKKARDLRLLIQKNRTQGVMVWHKTNKEMFLRGGQYVDAIKNVEIAVNQRMEENLEQIEKHAEIKEKARIEALNIERAELVDKYGVDGALLKLGTMSDDVWDAYFSGVVSKFEAEQERIKKEEEERQAELKRQEIIRTNKDALLPYSTWIDGFETLDFEKVDLISILDSAKKVKLKKEQEIEAQRIENERLKKEADEKEKALEAERKKAKEEADRIEAERQAEIQKERDKQAELEAELKAKKDAEAQSEKDRLAKIEADKKEAKKLAKAPIKKQLTVWVDSFIIPNVNVDNATSKEIIAKFEAFKSWSKMQIENL